MDFHQLAHDFGQRYANSWVFFQQSPDEEPKLVYLVRVLEEKGYPLIEFVSDELGSNTVRYDTDSVFTFKRPEMGTFQHGKHACIIQRAFGQTYSKGVNSKTYNIAPIYYRSTGVSKLFRTNVGWGEGLASAFKAVHVPWDKALHYLRNLTCSSCSLSKRYSVALSASTKDLDIYHYDYVIGRATIDGKLKFDPEEVGAGGLRAFI